ncbi:MAG: phospholipid carrier-dependent glycosyltransferase, partial [Thermodesulfobacteriota bacterium]
AYANSSYIVLRLVPNLFGALLPVCIFSLVRSLRGSTMAALFAGITIVFENAILVQSHFILVDSMLFFFGFFGLTLFFFHRNYTLSVVYLFLSGVFFALSFSVKWTGMSFLLLAWVVSLWDMRQKLRDKAYLMRQFPLLILTLILIPLLVYMLVFAVHFSLLDKSGKGDSFMSKGFLKTLRGTSVEKDDSVKPMHFVGKFRELNRRMYSSNASLASKHPSSSKFYTWPVMLRPIFYWSKKTSDGFRARIYLLGNPFIWWASLGGLVAGLFFWRASPPDTKWFLYLGWYLNFFPFFYIKRVMFLYHYFPALIFSILIMSIFLFDGVEALKRYRKTLFIGLASLFVIGFIFFSPLTYGFPLSTEQFDLRVWLKGWR